jgi:uncharacterized protein involved in outer membrane biogenesis
LSLQTTLLGLAIAIILALVAALVGPLMIDWGGYRALFEKEATSLVGVPVHVTGAIDARLLPTPQLTLHDIAIGSADKIRARSLGIEFALGPLMRGQWQASQLRLVGPQLSLGLDAKGHLKAPALAVGFDPDALTIQHLTIQDGRLTLSDAANSSKVTLDKLWFNGQARSLLGPFQGEGAATFGNDLYPFRLTSGRYGNGRLALHLDVDPVNYPLSIKADGDLILAAGAPRFDGKLNLTRPVGIAAGSKSKLSQPWQIGGKIKVTSASALMQDIEFQYGSEDKGFKLTGDADLKFGKRPRFDGVLSARQIDLDATLAGDDGSRPPPAAALRKIAELAGGAFRPAIPMQIGIGIDQVTLGGNALQNVRGDISTDAQGWNLDRFEFRAPGYTQVRLSGRLNVADDRVAFTGPAEIKTNNPKLLTAWLEGRPPAGKGALQPLSLRGDLTFASDKIAVEHLSADIERKNVTGRFAYYFGTGGRPARLDAALHAPDLDVDAALGFGRALFAGSHIARPHDMTIAADIGHATIAGFTARDLSARVKVDADGLRIDKLSVADLGGAAFSASGRIVTAPSPQGTVQVELNAPDVAPVIALVSRFAPQTAAALQRGAPAMAPAKLHASLTVQGASPAAVAKLTVAGSLGKVQLALNGETDADLTSFKSGEMRLSGKLVANDGKLLVAMLGLDHVVAVGSAPGTLSFDASGPLRGDLKVDGKLSAGGLQAGVSGTMSPFAESPAADLRASIARADLAPLRRGGAAALPVNFSSHVALADQNLSLNNIDASVAGTSLRGKVGVALSRPHRLQGEIEADHVAGAALIAAAIGMPASAKSKTAAWSWSDAPFGTGIFGDYRGSIALKARRVGVLPQAAAREFSATLKFGKGRITLDKVAGDLAGGRLSGRLSFQATPDGLSAETKLSLNGADLDALLPSGARPPVAGTLALSGDVKGSGLSPVALIGSLQGSGKFTLSDAQFAGLDPRAFDAVTRAVDQGLAIDANRISDVVGKALQSGRLEVKQAQGALAISAGQVRLTKFDAESDAAKLSMSGNLDLTGGMLDARLVLSGAGEAAGTRPDIFMALRGPVTAPERSIDVSALTGWLTLRAIEIQAKKVRELERERALERQREQELEKERAARTPPAPPKSTVPAPAPIAQPAPPAKKDNAAAPLELTPAPKSKAKPNPKPRPAPARAFKPQRAPALPPPVVIGPLPTPGGAVKPEASAVGPQR